jgi:glycosyltransferase involved in cell wall biosynthesis
MVAYETASAGKPLLASRIGGLQDIVVDGETGLLVTPGDIDALRRALARLIGDGELRERLGAGAAAHARQHFSAQAVVPRFEEAYRTAMEIRAGGR